MKPSFNILSDCKFFQDTGDKNEGSTSRGNKDPNIKISWFEEQVDTYVSRRIVSNYQVYDYRQSSQKESPAEKARKTSYDIAGIPDEKMIIFKQEDIEENAFPDCLKKLYTFSTDKISNSMLSRGPSVEASFDAMPCEVTGITESKFNLAESGCHDSKTYYDATGESTEISDDVPLSVLETFIQNALDTSLAKFKDEINKTIDTKFKSLKYLPDVEMSNSCLEILKSTCTDVDAPTVIENQTNQTFTCPVDSSDLEKDKFEDVAPVPVSPVDDSSRENTTSIFHLMQPEIRNFLLKPECLKHFQSESINIIKSNMITKNKSRAEKNETNESEKLVIGADNCDKGHRSLDLNNESIECSEKNSNARLSALPFDYTDGNKPEINPDAQENPNMLNPINNIRSSSENVVSDVIHKNANPKLLTDMTKFMYIIIESFRRLKEENMRKRSNNSLDTEISVALTSKSREVCCTNGTNNIQDKEQSIEEPEINHLPNENSLSSLNESQEQIKDVCSVANISTIPDCKTPNNSTDVVVRESCDEKVDYINICPEPFNVIISNLPSVPVPDTLNIEDEPKLETKNSGYTIQKFQKANEVKLANSKPMEVNKILDNLKEQYLQKFSSTEQSIDDQSDIREKYKCQIKKKFSSKNNLLGTRFDSRFYCNLTSSKSSFKEKEKSSDIKSIKRVSTKSSNIISMRHSLIRSRHRGPFKSSSRKTEVSLDSTIISLLNINVKNRSSWLKKLSSMSGSSAEEDKCEEKGNLLKRLCFVKFAFGRKGDNILHMVDRHLTNIYNAISLDFVTDDVYKSVMYISEHLRSSDHKIKDEIMRRWVKICNRPLEKERKSFNLECLHQFWVQFRTKICHLARPPPNLPPGFFPALTYPSEENRLIKEHVIQKYAKDILEYISDPKLFKHNISVS